MQVCRISVKSASVSLDKGVSIRLTESTVRARGKARQLVTRAVSCGGKKVPEKRVMNSPEKYHTVQKGRDLQGRETTQGYVPVIDISGFVPGQPRESPANLSLCDEVDAAFRQAGFFIATGHGVPPELLASAKRVCREFFSLSPGEKGAVAHPKKGFIPVGGCQNQVRSTSLHEKWSCGRVDGIDPSTEYYQNSVYFGEPNLWPQRPHDFEPTMTRYYKEMEALTLRLLSLTATALRLPHTFFDDKMDRHVTNLVALRYPPQVREPAPGEMRARPHTDPTALTVLAHDKEPGEPSGLEVLHDTMGSWEPIPVVAGGLVVNVGVGRPRGPPPVPSSPLGPPWPPLLLLKTTGKKGTRRPPPPPPAARVRAACGPADLLRSDLL